MAFAARDAGDQLSESVELDGAAIGSKCAGNQAEVLVAIERKSYVDKNVKIREKAGFAKVVLAPETQESAENFVANALQPATFVNTDGSPALCNLSNADVDSQVTNSDVAILEQWLP